MPPTIPELRMMVQSRRPYLSLWAGCYGVKVCDRSGYPYTRLRGNELDAWAEAAAALGTRPTGLRENERS